MPPGSFKPAPKHPSQTPWANVSPPVPSESVAHAALRSSVDPQHNARFHHYFKKHMTMLGLEKDLSSSDTDSETSENFQTKLFRRRQHHLKPIRTQRQMEEEELRRRKEASPWVQRCASVADLGHAPDEAPPRPGGKKVYTEEYIAASVTRKQVRERPAPREKPLERVRRLREEVEHTRPFSCTIELTDGFEVEHQRSEQRRRAKLDPLPPPPPPPSKHAYDPVAESRAEAAEIRQWKASRKKTRISQATSRKLIETVERLRRDHQESLKLHDAVMRCVSATPS